MEEPSLFGNTQRNGNSHILKLSQFKDTGTYILLIIPTTPKSRDLFLRAKDHFFLPFPSIFFIEEELFHPQAPACRQLLLNSNDCLSGFSLSFSIMSTAILYWLILPKFSVHMS